MPEVTEVLLNYGIAGAILLVVGTVLLRQFQAQADRLAEQAKSDQVAAQAQADRLAAQCQRESDRADRLEGELRDLHAKMSTEVVPLLTQLAAVLERRERRHDADGR